MFTATLAGKGEETPSPLLPLPPSSLPESSSLLLNSSSLLSSTFPSFSTPHATTITSAKLPSAMPSKNSNVPFQQFNKIPSTMTNVNEEVPITTEQQDNSKDLDNVLPSTSSSSNSRRRVPLPTKLSFEQNITNMIEKESPLLQSELLTAEHELSVLRSRLAVNEGVTAITGTILESLKGQFDAHHKVDRTTSPFDTSRTNLLQQSLAIQTSPSNEKLPDSLEIHYDAESPKSHYIVVKAVNSFWVAQPIPHSQVQEHLQKFSSPVMKRAAIKLPDSFEFDSDTDIPDEAKQQQQRSHDSISDDDESVILDRYEQLSEMKTIRSSSLLQHEDPYENFENKIEEIYLIIDQLRHKSLTPAILNTLQKKINDLKFILHKLNFNKQDRLHVDYQLSELESQCTQRPMPKQYDFIDLFENDLNSLQHIIEHVKTNDTQSQRDLISDFEDKLELIQTIDEDASSNEYKPSPKQQPRRLIPENPVITSDVFFEGDKTLKSKKTPATPPNHRRLIPEDARISASSFYEGDVNRSLYHHVDVNKDAEQSPKKKPLIPEKPLVSSEVFYEGSAERSLFTKSAVENPPESNSPPVSIENLREIMSDLMLAASWSRKPTRIEKQPTHEEEEEILAESFITTERRHSKSSLCEIIHEIEKLPSSTFVEDQLNKSRHPTIIEEDETLVEKAREPLQEDLSSKKSPNEVAFIFVSPPSLEQDDEDESSKADPIPTDPSNENELCSSEYEALLRQTSNEIVGRILNDAISEAIEYEQEQLYYKTAVQLVQNAIENALIKYDNELTPSEFSSTSSEHNDEANSDGYLSSDDDNEENEKLIPQISDQPYLFVTDVVASKSAQELGDLVQELQTLEHRIPHTRPRSSSSSSSSSSSQSDNERSRIAIPQIITAKSVTELTNLVDELQDMEEQLEDRLDEPLERIKSPISSKSFNELGGLMSELQTVSKQLNNRIHEEIFISTNIDSLSEDIIKYRRDSLAALQQLDENQAVQDMVDNIIKEARDIMIRESNLKSIPTIVVDQRRLSGERSSATSISDDLGLSHEDSTIDPTMELAAQLDYLRRMSRYDNSTYDQPSFTSSTADSHEDNEDFKSASYMTMTNEDATSSDEDSHHPTKSNQQIDISRDSVTQPSSDSLDYHSTEVDINQSETPRRTTSEHSLWSTSSSLQTHEPHSLSTLCLIDKDELVPSDNDQETANIGFLDRMKLLVNKPVEIIQEAIENLGQQRVNDLATSASEQQQQHFQSAHDLHDEEKSKLVRSPELYNIGNVVRHDQRSLLTSSQIQYRTMSESALASDDSKRHSLTTTSNDASVEFLTALSKENSMEFSQQRLSTPFDDVLEKESSPEQSECHPPPTSAFSDAIEPTSSCQRPLAFRVTGQQHNISEEQFYTVANDLVHQVLNDVVSELNDEQENSSAENISDRLSISNNSSSSSDGEDEKLAGIDEEEVEEYMPDPSPPSPPKILSIRPAYSKVLRRAQTDTKHFDIIQSPVSLVPPMIRRNSQSDTDVYFHAVSPSLHDYGEMQNSSSDEECSIRKRHEKYSGEGEDSSGGGGERPTSRRKRSTDQTNTHESLTLKFESNDNSKRRESLDSPPKDSTEKSLLKTLQEGILRTNLESLQTELKLASPHKDYLQVNVYSSVTKKPSANYDYDAGSETDRDDTVSKTHRKSIDVEAKSLLDDMVESINSDNLSKSISSEPVSSQSDATTVIFKSNKTSLDDEEHCESSSHLNTNQFLLIHPSFSSSASSSPSVIYQQQMQTNLTSIVNTQSKKQFSTPSLSTTEFIGQCTKKKYPSYPGSLGASHIPSSASPLSTTSIPDDYHTMPATPTTLQSGQQHVDE